VLRTASDYDMPPPGMTAAALLAQDASETGESAYRESLESAYRVGYPVVDAIATHWDRYRDHPPRVGNAAMSGSTRAQRTSGGKISDRDQGAASVVVSW
jgi:hypothetical protein